MGKMRSRARRLTIVTMFVALALAGALAPAGAASSTQATSVSCDGVTIKTGITVTHDPSGTFKIRQNSSSPKSSTKTWARSSNGNDLSVKTVGDNGTATWTGVLASNYTIKAFRSGSANCNGWWPGHGNYTWNYTVIHN